MVDVAVTVAVLTALAWAGGPGACPAARAGLAAAPAGAGRIEPFGLVPDSPSARAGVTLAPGARAALLLRVVNGGSRRRAFLLTASGAGGWIDLPGRVSVGPRESRRVIARVAVPEGATPGVRRGALAVRPAEPPSRAPVGVAYRMAAPVVVRVTP